MNRRGFCRKLSPSDVIDRRSPLFSPTVERFSLPMEIKRFMDEKGCQCGGKGECLKAVSGWASKLSVGPSGFAYETCAGNNYYAEAGFPSLGFTSPASKEKMDDFFDCLGMERDDRGMSLLDFPSPLCTMCMLEDEEEEEKAQAETDDSTETECSARKQNSSSQYKGGPSESESLRESGNEHYMKVNPDVAPARALVHLEKASVLYRHALTAASDDSEAASALKNLAMTSFKTCMILNDTEEPLENIHRHVQKALCYFSRALRHGTVKKWLEGVKTSLRKFSYFALEMVRERSAGVMCAYYLYDFTVELKLPSPLATIYLVIGAELVEAGGSCLERGDLNKAIQIQPLCAWAIKGAFRHGKGKKAVHEQAGYLKERFADFSNMIAAVTNKFQELTIFCNRIAAEDTACGKDDERFLRFVYKAHPPLEKSQSLPKTLLPWDSLTSKQAMEAALQHYDYTKVKVTDETVTFKIIAKHVQVILERRIIENYELL